MKKKDSSKMKLLSENKKAGQVTVSLSLDLYLDLEELLGEDNLDVEIANKRSQDPNRELLFPDQLSKELGL